MKKERKKETKKERDRKEENTEKILDLLKVKIAVLSIKSFVVINLKNVSPENCSFFNVKISCVHLASTKAAS